MRERRNPDNQADLIETLKTGLYPSEDEAGNALEPPTEAILRKAWLENRESIMAEYYRDHATDARPWAWWFFDCGAAILAQAGRSWPLTVVGRRGGIRIRNRAALSSYEQERLLSGGTLPRVEPHAPTRNIVM